MGEKARTMVMMYGRMGSGKSFIANKLKEKLGGRYNIEVTSSSKTIKEHFSTLCDVFSGGKNLSEIEGADQTIPVDLIEKTVIPNLISGYMRVKDRWPKLASLYKRQALQIYGTELPMLKGFPTIWIEDLMKQLDRQNSEVDLYINDGCRFGFEIDTVRYFGVRPIVVHLDSTVENVISVFNDRYTDGDSDAITATLESGNETRKRYLQANFHLILGHASETHLDYMLASRPDLFDIHLPPMPDDDAIDMLARTIVQMIDGGSR